MVLGQGRGQALEMSLEEAGEDTARDQKQTRGRLLFLHLGSCPPLSQGSWGCKVKGPLQPPTGQREKQRRVQGALAGAWTDAQLQHTLVP